MIKKKSYLITFVFCLAFCSPALALDTSFPHMRQPQSQTNVPKAAPTEQKQLHKKPVKKPSKITAKNSRFSQCDQDQDGALSLDEYLQCFPASTKQQFQAIDVHRRGFITEKDMDTYQSGQTYKSRYAATQGKKKSKTTGKKGKTKSQGKRAR